jgi:hypothetical protein
VLELTPAQTAIISCQDLPTILSHIPAMAGSINYRVAADELLLIASSAEAQALLAHASNAQRAAGGEGIAMNVSDAWSVLTARGPDIGQMLGRLSSNPMPASRPGFVQGIFAQVPAKLILFADAVHIIVPSPVANHVRKRIFSACHDLSPRWLTPRPFAVDATPATPAPMVRAVGR